MSSAAIISTKERFDEGRALAGKLLDEFSSIVGVGLELPADYDKEVTRLCAFLTAQTLRPREARRSLLLGHINRKFRFNAEGIAQVFAEAAAQGTTFNYHRKVAIQWAFDTNDAPLFRRMVLGAAKRLVFAPIPERETLARFRAEVETPSKLRRDMGDRPIGREILLAAFSAFLFSVADEEVLHAYFDPLYEKRTYEASFWRQLRRYHPELYSRERTLDIVRIEQPDSRTYQELRDYTLSVVRDSYVGLTNYGHLAILLGPTVVGDRLVTQELAADATLYAEKHVEVQLQKGYFLPNKVAETTRQLVPGVDDRTARFDLANEGFTYRDCFVLAPSAEARMEDATLLLIFQKNERDDTLVPCPACRSHNVRGNSYSSIGVRSWECNNQLCPDRSKYNRGKRYAFKNLLMQEAIEEDEGQIPVASVRSWSRDVQVGRTTDEAVEMLVRHYSLHGDTISTAGIDIGASLLGRVVRPRPLVSTTSVAFFDSAWFSRYIVDCNPTPTAAGAETMVADNAEILHGDAASILAGMQESSIDGAVTSPPYYNAREYSQWANIYGYLHDMFAVAQGMFRVLKPGAIYFYNIFDGFDNENSIVFSAMGQKRVILSAYATDLHRRAGFECIGNIAWDKGEIEGKRGFNAGNFSPYYQAPFNCWEHVLVFRKPGPKPPTNLPAILRAKPVMKMVRGENVHGHTAPFPEELPELILPFVPIGGSVLDPFGGSGTTARVAARAGRRGICIERSDEYCRLAASMLATGNAQQALF